MFRAHHPAEHFAAAVTSCVTQNVVDVTTTELGKGFFPAGKIPILGGGKFAFVVVHPQILKLAGKLGPDIAHHVQQVCPVPGSLLSIGSMGIVRQLIQDNVFRPEQ